MLPRQRGRSMDTSIVFLHIAVILTTAHLLAELAGKFGMPTVIGELAAGILLGPSLLGWITPNEIIHLLAEIGLILLLFDVGLDTDVGRLINAGPRAAIVAIGGFVVPFLLGFLLTHYAFGFSMLVSLFIGGTLTATSIGVTVRILRDVGRQNSHEGQIVLGAAVLDDVLGVLVLAVLYEFSVSGEVSLLNVAKVTMFVGVFFFTAPLAAKLISSLIRRLEHVSRVPGVIATTISSLVLAFAWLAHAIGAPELLGGFAAGLALSRRFFLPFGIAIATHPRFSHHIDLSMRPIIELFSPIFFVTVGLSLDLRAVEWQSSFIWTFSLSILFVAILGKMAGGFLLRREHPLTRTAIGMSMVPRGEVGLVFAGLGQAAGVFGPQVYAGVIIVIAYTTLLAPFWIKSFYKKYGNRPQLFETAGETTADGSALSPATE